ncbi:uncharacterized protein [Eurosta solidaginis]|uniref:uncharacterized protein n=1 Tax=Eurosta solidaginis TaxID=178769 RepID=UPI003530BF69
MDKAAFIAEVRKREFLWNRKTRQLHANDKRKFEELWKEVGAIFGLSGPKAKAIWRGIRDQFYKRISAKKVPIYIFGDNYYIEEHDKPPWQYFEPMMFVLDSYKPDQNVVIIDDIPTNDIPLSVDSNCSYGEDKTQSETNTFPSITYEQDNDTNISAVEIKEEPEFIIGEEPRMPLVDSLPPLAMVKPQLPAPAFTSIKRVYTLDETDDLDVTKSKNEQTTCPSKKGALESVANQSEPRAVEVSDDENENFIFLRSLLPFMKKLDPVQQLRVRMRFQESLLEQLGQKR